MRVRRELVVCALTLMWSHRTAASEEDLVVESASANMKCTEFQLVHEAHKYYVAGCGQQRTYDCGSGKCVTIAAHTTRAPAAKKKTTSSDPEADDACVAKNIMLDTAYAGCMCLSLMGGSVPANPPSPPSDTCR